MGVFVGLSFVFRANIVITGAIVAVVLGVRSVRMCDEPLSPSNSAISEYSSVGKVFTVFCFGQLACYLRASFAPCPEGSKKFPVIDVVMQ